MLNKNGEAVFEVYDAANNASRLTRDFNNVKKFTHLKFDHWPFTDYSVPYIARLAKILILIYKGLSKISFERRDYVSVDERAYLSLCPEKLRKKK